LTSGTGAPTKASDAVGYSIYFMLFMMAAMVSGVVFLILKNGKTKLPPRQPDENP